MVEPAARRRSLVKKGSFWVHTGEVAQGYDILKAIDEDREERIRKAWGPRTAATTTKESR